MSNLQPSPKRGKYGNDERRSQKPTYEEGSPRKKFGIWRPRIRHFSVNYWCENSPKIDYNSILCLSIKRKSYFAVDFHNCAPTHLSTDGFECQILKIQKFSLGNLHNRVFSLSIGESGFSSKIGASPPKSGWLDTLQSMLGNTLGKNIATCPSLRLHCFSYERLFLRPKLFLTFFRISASNINKLLKVFFQFFGIVSVQTH